MRTTLVGSVVLCAVLYAAESRAQHPHPVLVQPAPVEVHVQHGHEGCLPRVNWTITTDGYQQQGRAGLLWEKRTDKFVGPFGTTQRKQIRIFPFPPLTYRTESDIRYTLVPPPQPRPLPCPCR